MNLKNTSQRYGLVSIILHWLGAIGVFVLFFLGLWMMELDYYDAWYKSAPALHKSIGFVVVLLFVVRFLWRSYSKPPTALKSHKYWEVLVAKVIHTAFYCVVVSMLISGYLITTSKGQPLEVLGFIALPATVTGIENLEHYASEVHEFMAFLIVGVATLHGLAALKHHFFDKDTTLKRMLGL
ncbi:cytochrome b [Teredinibacter purpureus]|uniref:cytochrome b n=1 Tax=Teredinibacter purpureus TaxID=2731756 RepID=UPI0005F81BF1|nr:cytochrome b [Teredinibacter purpureus]